MFTLSRIAVKNFMSIAEQEIEFNEGILGITGENGSGKSSLLNAIGLCLTEYRAGDSLRDYVKAGELEARVNLEGFYKGYPISYEVMTNHRPYGNPLKRKVPIREESMKTVTTLNLLNTRISKISRRSCFYSKETHLLRVSSHQKEQLF